MKGVYPMNPKFKEILDALQQGDLDKLSKAIFLASLQQDITFDYVIPGKPLFITAEARNVENSVIKTLKIDLYYPGWTLMVVVDDDEEKVTFGYSVIKSEIEGVHIHE